MSAASITAATRQTFNALRTKTATSVSSVFLVGFLERTGLTVAKDPRLGGLKAALESLSALDQDRELTLAEFAHGTHSCSSLLHRAVVNNFRVPDFQTLTGIIDQVYEEVEKNTAGENATYIPQLARVDPEQFSVSFTSIDGQHYSVGHSDRQFCIQSCSKPLSYLIALHEFGEDYVHAAVGKEPSGQKFNAMMLKSVPRPDDPSHAIPHNPMINAGAIMTVSMVYPDFNARRRLEAVLTFWRKLCEDTPGAVEGTNFGGGGAADHIGYDDETYRSESGSADRNWCLGYMMKECNAFPPCFDARSGLSDTLELYFQLCSITATNRASTCQCIIAVCPSPLPRPCLTS
jgi:glutaminase